jgi:hypothetical protein
MKCAAAYLPITDGLGASSSKQKDLIVRSEAQTAQQKGVQSKPLPVQLVVSLAAFILHFRLASEIACLTMHTPSNSGQWCPRLQLLPISTQLDLRRHCPHQTGRVRGNITRSTLLFYSALAVHMDDFSSSPLPANCETLAGHLPPRPWHSLSGTSWGVS